MPDFIPGLELCGRFYAEIVRPLLDSEFPSLPHTAALIGEGSEVLSFDTEMSTDHDWGPRLQIFLSAETKERYGEQITASLSHSLPPTFLGYKTGFEPKETSTGRTETTEPPPLQHRVTPLTLSEYCEDYLHFDIHNQPTPTDWLTLPAQKLRAITAGAIYHDGIELETVRSKFEYYPHDVWLYLLMAGWNRIGQEEHLMGRAGYVGDEVGSAIIGARLVRDIMHLCFLMERQYAPYPKWFGTAFRRLECGEALVPILQRALQAPTWQERQDQLANAYEFLAHLHNRLEITEPLPTSYALFYTRPFKVIHLDGGFAEAIHRRITDPEVLRIATKRWLGNIDQISDNTDLLCGANWRPQLRTLYE